ncbi:protein of unknown function (plasmid) [Cupriavidus taiwanensis]|uniref:Uncharacterized protein n=1 Tax=Cupriavidus taiwanensis TaxID=164546 RepID=A0A375IMS7_9BURK|nr:protein of unknown function [Cupriavidus taiwanensis]
MPPRAWGTDDIGCIIGTIRGLIATFTHRYAGRPSSWIRPEYLDQQGSELEQWSVRIQQYFPASSNEGAARMKGSIVANKQGQS